MNKSELQYQLDLERPMSGLIKTKVKIGGKRNKKLEEQGLGIWDQYSQEFINDLNTAIDHAAGRYGGMDSKGNMVTAAPQDVASESTFWRPVTNKQGQPVAMKDIDEDGKEIRGDKIEVSLKVGGDLVKGVFPPRIAHNKTKGDYEVEGSREKALTVHQNLVQFLHDIRDSAANIAKNDGGLGQAIYETAKAVKSPARRVKKSEREAALAAKPFCEALDMYLPLKDHPA